MLGLHAWTGLDAELLRRRFPISEVFCFAFLATCWRLAQVYP